MFSVSHYGPKEILQDKSVESFYWANEKLLDADRISLARDYLKFKKIEHGYGISTGKESKRIISYFRYSQNFLDSKEVSFDQLPDYIKTHILLMGYTT